MSVRVGADKGLMSGEMFLTILHPQFLCFLYGQTVVGGIPGIKTDNVVVALYVLPPAVLFILHVRPQAGDRKILIPAIHSFNLVTFTWNHPPGFILYWFHVKFIMLKGQILFCRSVIGVFRADMFYRCHRLLRSFSALQISKRQGQRHILSIQRQVPGRESRTHLGVWQSGLSCCQSSRTAPLDLILP